MKWSGLPVSKTYLKQVAYEDNVRKIKKVDICPICAGISKTESSDEQIRYHKELAHTQMTVVMSQVRELTACELLVVQDFTQLPLTPSGFIQDLIFVVYRKTPDTGELDRTYHHYVGDEGRSNDIQFVKAGWSDLLLRLPLSDCKILRIWSDGGRKHFKQTGHMMFWENKQEELRGLGVTIEYNFYASYHGHNACDAVAHHCKSLLKNYELDHDVPVASQSDLVGLFQRLKHSRTSAAPENHSIRLKYDTMAGISRCHRFLFPERGMITGFRSSLLSEEEHNFCTKNLLK